MSDDREPDAGSSERSNRWFGTAPVVVVVILLVVGGWFLASWLLSPDGDRNPIGEDPNNDSGNSPVSYTPPATDGFAGSAACADCHADLFAHYSNHPMYRSTRRVDQDDSPPGQERNESRVPGVKRVIEIEDDAGQMVHHEMMYDAAGRPICDTAYAMEYLVGSGQRAKSYLRQVENVLFMSPLNYYSQTDKWDLAPRYVADDPRRFDAMTSDMCLGCHAGRLAPVGHGVHRFEAEPYLEMPIGCERCHGPGQAHIELHEAGSEVNPADDPIVNPADLDHAQRESVCYQCHLQSPVPRILRYGRSNLDFRPGQLIEDVWTVVDTSSGVGADGRIETVHQVQQMRESVCYQQSNKGMDCTSCHDPHRVPAPEERIEFYRNQCLKCHDDSSCSTPRESRDAVNDSCMQCHMPKRETVSTPHASQTDHRVLRDPTAPQESNAVAEALRFFDQQDERLGEQERRRATALAEIALARNRGEPPPLELESELVELLELYPEDGEMLIALGTIARRKGEAGRALTVYEQARRIPATEYMAIEALMDTCYLNKDPTGTLQYADELLSFNPQMTRAHTLRADALVATGRTEEGIDAALEALRLDPGLAEVRLWLMGVYRSLGRVDEEREQRELYERIQSARVPGS